MSGAYRMDTWDTIIIGGGIAGLAAAHGLLRAGAGRVRLLERESVPYAHSSGKNAAIFRHVATNPGDIELAQRSRALLTELLGSEDAWLRRSGAWFVSAAQADLEPLAVRAVRADLPHARARDGALYRATPWLSGGTIRCGLWFADDGVIDVHAVSQALSRAVVDAGGVLSFGAEVARIEVEQGRVAGVELKSGEHLAAGAVVIAAGAWGGALGAAAGAPLLLEPRLRHLAQLQVEPPMAADAPVVWCVGDDELYFRPESGGMLASPCDEAPWQPESPEGSERAMLLLAKKLGRLAPRLSDASVRRSWAGLRTFTPDAAPAIGPDPRRRGLHWLVGLGGHGMTGGAAAGELLGAVMAGRDHPLAKMMAPARLL